MAQEDSDDFDIFLKRLQHGTKREVDNLLLSERNRKADDRSDSQKDHTTKLIDALKGSNVAEVWKLIAENKFTETLENLNETCKAIAAKEDRKDEGCKYICKWNCKKLCTNLKYSLHWLFERHPDNRNEEREMQSEKEQKSIEILCNPLYISLEWLWRNNPNSQYEKGIRRKESKFADIIEAALDDSYLLEKIASYEHHYSRDEYKGHAVELEQFAADIIKQVKGSDLKQLQEIMDIEGQGSLLKKKPDNFIHSLGLLKMAADKQRKKVSLYFSIEKWNVDDIRRRKYGKMQTMKSFKFLKVYLAFWECKQDEFSEK